MNPVVKSYHTHAGGEEKGWFGAGIHPALLDSKGHLVMGSEWKVEIMQAAGLAEAARMDTSMELAAGSTYTFPMGQFHASGADQLTATFMSKTLIYHNDKPHVLVPHWQEPDNDFDRYGFQEEELWAMVERAVGAINCTNGY